MIDIKTLRLPRRHFLERMTAVAGAASSLPLLIGSGTPDSAVLAETQTAGAETGQTIRLADYTVQLRHEQIPAAVLQRAKDCITDTIATILFGAQFPWSKMIVAQAQRTSQRGKCSILGTGSRVGPLAAALAHGAMTHAFEQDNLTLPDSGAHPGAALVSSGLAIAQAHDLSGRDLLTAFVAGAEVMIRIGLATKRTNEARGFHAPGTLGSFGAAVASGKLMGFDTPKMTNALGIAASTSGGLLEFSHSGNGAMIKRLHLGRAAEGGVLAAILASEGFTGPTTVIEGPAGFLKAFCNETDNSQLTLGLEKEYQSLTIMLKRFACHITAHTPVEATIALREMHGISGADVASIKIEGSRRMATVNNITNPKDILIGQFSIPFCVALALYRNALDPYSFDEGATHDAAIKSLASRITLVAVPGQVDADVSSTVSIQLKNGGMLMQRMTDFLGAPSRPLTGGDLRKKFLLLTQKCPTRQMERIFDRLQNLESETHLAWLHV